MGKDHRQESKRCTRCGEWTESETELCDECQEDALEEVPFSVPEYLDPLDQARADSMVGGE
jgi:predicted amidophosphoribosyltransferase